MSDGLTLDELARRLEEGADHLSEWRSLGLIGRAHSDTFGPDDVERARLVQTLRRRGIELAAIVRADRDEAFLARYVSGFGAASGTYSLAQAARRLGMGVDTLERLVEAAQLTDRRELLSDEDVETFAGIKVALEAGFPEEVLAQLLRVYVDALGRVAETENRLFHFYVHEPRRAQGMRAREAVEGGREPSLVPIWGDASADRLLPLIEPAVRYFHRQAWRRALTEDAVMHLEEYTGVREDADVPGRLLLAGMPAAFHRGARAVHAERGTRLSNPSRRSLTAPCMAIRRRRSLSVSDPSAPGVPYGVGDAVAFSPAGSAAVRSRSEPVATYVPLVSGDIEVRWVARVPRTS
jgi:hypothetical protein